MLGGNFGRPSAHVSTGLDASVQDIRDQPAGSAKGRGVDLHLFKSSTPYFTESSFNIQTIHQIQHFSMR